MAPGSLAWQTEVNYADQMGGDHEGPFAAAGALLTPAHALRAQLLITGNDEKVSFDENTGKTITHPAGKDTVSIIDISAPAKAKIIVNLPLMNTITGPPVNLAITPDRHLALQSSPERWQATSLLERCREHADRQGARGAAARAVPGRDQRHAGVGVAALNRGARGRRHATADAVAVSGRPRRRRAGGHLDRREG